MRLIKSFIKEKKKKKMSPDENPCWDGYEMVGTKMKDGKEVPNCVPISKESVKTYLSKDLLDARKTMKEYNDSTYKLHISYKKSEEKDSSYKYESDKLLYSSNKILPNILNYLDSYLDRENIEFTGIKQKDDFRLEILTNDPNIEVILEKEMTQWRPFEIGQVYAEFEK